MTPHCLPPSSPRYHRAPLHPPTPLRPGGHTHSIIRSHCSASSVQQPPHPLANGTNLYSLSALMSSHAERWPYHRASGSHHLSPSPAACQARRDDGQAESVQERGWMWWRRCTLVSIFIWTLVTPDRCPLVQNRANNTNRRCWGIYDWNPNHTYHQWLFSRPQTGALNTF